MNSLEVSITIPSDKAATCKKAIEMETKSDALRRSEVELQQKGDLLLIRIDAKDLTALRGSMNTYLKWVDMCLELVGE